MFRRFFAILVASCGALAIAGASLLAVAPQASATASCPQTLCVYQFRSNAPDVSAPVGSLPSLAFGVPNSFGDGSRVELRHFSVTRTTEQWQPGVVSGEFELRTTGLCLTGNAHRAYVRTCSGWPSQIWTPATDTNSNISFTNGKKLSLVVPMAAAYANVTTSSSSHAIWTPYPGF